jgi:hypothetical protein
MFSADRFEVTVKLKDNLAVRNYYDKVVLTDSGGFETVVQISASPRISNLQQIPRKIHFGHVNLGEV